VSNSQSTTQTVEKTTTKVQPPSMFDVIFYNDNKTYFEFVVLILMQLFNKDLDQATEITHLIHQKGRAPVATYTYEVAAAKRDETVATARANGHPLRVEIEPQGEQS
jgi:ATP-dependent Clp protease adaptor protein ClpS